MQRYTYDQWADMLIKHDNDNIKSDIIKSDNNNIKSDNINDSLAV